MNRAKWPFLGRIALDFGDNRMVVISITRVNDYEGTIWIEQAGIVHSLEFARSRVFNAHSLLSGGKYRVTLAQRPRWGK